MSTHGKFITFEGGEGAGKSTHTNLLAERLRARGIKVLITREPGGSPFAERLRQILLDGAPEPEPRTPLSETLLFYAARADHLERVIRPALREGQWVICDRFSDSTRVYQGHAGATKEQIIEALELLVVTPTKPNLTFIIDLPPEIGLGRAAVRSVGDAFANAKSGLSRERGQAAQGLLADRYEGRSLDFHRQVRDGFLKIAAIDPERCVVINGQKTTDEVAAAIWDAVDAKFFTGAP
jgi:dTMP kinase